MAHRVTDFTFISESRMEQVDTERRSRLLALKLRALIREHLGLTGDPDGRVEVFAPGAAFITNDAVWLLIDGDAARSLGGVLAWGTKFELPIHLVVENDSGLLARRAALFDVDITVWHADERVLLPALAEPHLPTTQAKPEHLAFTELIQSSGADALVEHGIVVGEVRGLEMCRVVDDVVSGVARLEVGMGVNDREAFAMVHGELPTEQALRNVIDAVAIHREPGANVYGAMSGLILPGRQVFLVDTHINIDPTAEQLTELTLMAANEMRKLGISPKVALLSHSNFGSSSAPSAIKMREVLALIQKADPMLEVDGEMPIPGLVVDLELTSDRGTDLQAFDLRGEADADGVDGFAGAVTEGDDIAVGGDL